MSAVDSVIEVGRRNGSEYVKNFFNYKILKVDLRNTPISFEAVRKLSASTVRQYMVFPFKVSEGCLHIAVDKINIKTIDSIKDIVKMPVKPYIADSQSIKNAISYFYPERENRQAKIIIDNSMQKDKLTNKSEVIMNLPINRTDNKNYFGKRTINDLPVQPIERNETLHDLMELKIGIKDYDDKDYEEMQVIKKNDTLIEKFRNFLNNEEIESNDYNSSELSKSGKINKTDVKSNVKHVSANQDKNITYDNKVCGRNSYTVYENNSLNTLETDVKMNTEKYGNIQKGYSCYTEDKSINLNRQEKQENIYEVRNMFGSQNNYGKGNDLDYSRGYDTGNRYSKEQLYQNEGYGTMNNSLYKNDIIPENSYSNSNLNSSSYGNGYSTIDKGRGPELGGTIMNIANKYLNERFVTGIDIDTKKRTIKITIEAEF